MDDTPIKLMSKDSNGNFNGNVLITSEGFRQFIQDHRLEIVSLRYVEKDWTFGRSCHIPSDPLQIPFVSDQYSNYFIATDDI